MMVTLRTLLIVACFAREACISAMDTAALSPEHQRFLDAIGHQDPVKNVAPIAEAFKQLETNEALEMGIGFNCAPAQSSCLIRDDGYGFIRFGSQSPFLPIFLRKFLLPAALSQTRAKQISSAIEKLGDAGVLGFQPVSSWSRKKIIEKCGSSEKCLAYIEAFARGKNDDGQYRFYPNKYTSPAPDRFYQNFHTTVTRFKKCVLTENGLKACIEEGGFTGAAAYLTYTTRGQIALVSALVTGIAALGYLAYRTYNKKSTDTHQDVSDSTQDTATKAPANSTNLD